MVYVGVVMKRTVYQQKHRPIKVVENKCTGKMGIDGICVYCGRILKQVAFNRNSPHLPNQKGFFGYKLYFGDGSVIDSNTDN